MKNTEHGTAAYKAVYYVIGYNLCYFIKQLV